MRVPASQLLGGGDANGFKTIMQALNSSRPIIAARAVGLAQGAVDHSVRFIRDQHAFGQAVADFQGIRWMVADMVSCVEASRLLTYRAAALADTGAAPAELAQQAAIAKCFASDMGTPSTSSAR